MTRARDVATQGGLTLISTTTVSAATEYVVNNLNPSIKYKLVGNVWGSSANALFQFRSRQNNVAVTSGYYGASYISRYNNSSGVHYWSNNAVLFTLFNIGTSDPQSALFDMDFYISADRTVMTLTGSVFDYYTNGNVALGCTVTGMTTCNGLSLRPDAGNTSGVISLYRYNV